MEKDGKQYVNKAAFAKLMNFDRSNLSKESVLKRLNSAIWTDEDGRVWIDPVAGKKILDRERDTAKVRKAAAPAPAQSTDDDDEDDFADVIPGSMDEARRKNIHLKNEDLALKLAKEKDQTVDRQKVIAAAAVVLQTAREGVYAQVPGLAERFATMTDAREIRTALDAALRTCFEGLVDEFKRRLPQNRAGEGRPSAH